jgi:GcrA cell cycle regulator
LKLAKVSKLNDISAAAQVKKFRARKAMNNLSHKEKPRVLPIKEPSKMPPLLAQVITIPKNERLPNGGIPLLSLERHHCRWPLWETGEYPDGFCGKACSSSGSFCEEHARIAYSGTGKRK